MFVSQMPVLFDERTSKVVGLLKESISHCATNLLLFGEECGWRGLGLAGKGRVIVTGEN